VAVAANPVLALGEMGIETDTNKAKYGDGFAAWQDLPYFVQPQVGAIVPDGTADGQTLRWEVDSGEWEASSDLIVNDAGNVLINTTAGSGSGENLSVVSAGSFAPAITVRNAVGGSWARMDFVESGASASAFIFQDSTGDLGFRNDSTGGFKWWNASTVQMAIDPTRQCGYRDYYASRQSIRQRQN
jgi:hypothetical protein